MAPSRRARKEMRAEKKAVSLASTSEQTSAQNSTPDESETAVTATVEEFDVENASVREIALEILNQFKDLKIDLIALKTDLNVMNTTLTRLEKKLDQNAEENAIDIVKKLAEEIRDQEHNDALIYVSDAAELMCDRLDELEANNELVETYRQRSGLTGAELDEFISETQIIRDVRDRLRKVRETKQL